ncbi:MAG: insulinase family protein [Phycisphaerae bacterium]|nr:insulinase family protein [Phycisphaerae bacterium]
MIDRCVHLRAGLFGALALWCLWWCAPAMGQAVEGGAAGVVIDDAPLAADARWVQGTLGNGVRYMVRTHDAVDGRVVLRLMVDAGSLRERTDELGSSFLVTMLLHAAAVDSPVGKAVLSLGEDLPAGVRATVADASQDAARFTVTLPLASEKALTLGLRHLRGIAAGAGLDDDSIMKHRPMARSQRSALITRKDRLLAAVMPQIAPGSKASSHLAVPSDAALCALENDTLRAFHARRFAPGRLTLIAAGDAPTETLIACIRQEFGSLAARAGDAHEEELPPESARVPELRAAVAADPEQQQAIAEIVVVHGESLPIRSGAAWRATMVDRVASVVLQRRLLASMDRAGSPVRGGGVRIGPAPGGSVVAVASVMGDPADWRRLVSEVALGVSRSCTESAPRSEVDAARQAVLRGLADAAAAEGSDDPAGLVEAASRAVVNGDVLLSRADEVERASRVLPGIDGADVQAALAGRFLLRDAAFILFMPDRAGTPPPVDILAAALPAILPVQGVAAAGARKREADAGEAAGPEPGRIESIRLEPSLGVTEAVLGNGIPFFHRRMIGAEPRVAIAVTLRPPVSASGDVSPPIEATSALWSAPAARSMGSEAMRGAMTAGRIEFRFYAGPSMARLEVTCPAASARDAMRMVHLLLSEPRVEASAFDRWKWTMAQRARAGESDPMTAAFDAMSAMFGAAGLPSAWNPTEDVLASITLESLQGWVDLTVTRGPIDAAMIGDLSRDEALGLALTYLASLPAREAKSDSDVVPLVLAEKRVETRGGGHEAAVLVAIHGADEGSSDAAALELAAQVLAARLNPRSGVEPPSTKPIIVKHVPSSLIGGAPLLIVMGTTSPNLTTSLTERIDGMFSALAADGPTDSELTKARANAVEEFDRRRNDSAWWARALSQSRATGRSLVALVDERSELIAQTKESVRDAVGRHDPMTCGGNARLRIVASPAESRSP